MEDYWGKTDTTNGLGSKMIVQLPLCYDCKRFKGAWSCNAYKDRIPDEIIDSKVDHHKPFAGDGGLTFIPIKEVKKTDGLATVFKENPYHDALGLFASKARATFVSLWGKPKNGSNEKELEKLSEQSKALLSKVNELVASNQYEDVKVEVNALMAKNQKLTEAMKEIEAAIEKDKPSPPPQTELTPEEKSEIVRRFTQSGGTYREVNGHLREGYETSEETTKTIKVLDDLFESSAKPMDKTLYRGMSGYEPDDLGLYVGAEFTDKGFVSTSGSVDEAKKFAAHDPSGKPQGDEAVGILFKINGAKGGKVLDLRGYSRYGEEELLLPRGAKFKVTSVKQGEPGVSFAVVTMSVV